MPTGPADLMPGDGEGIDTEICNIKGHMQPTLDGVGVIDGPVGMSYIGKCSDGLDDAGLVVGEHDRHKRDIGSHERFELGRFDISSTVGLDRIDREPESAKLREIVEDRIVLNRGNDNTVAPTIGRTSRLGKTDERQDVGLGSTTAKQYLRGAYARTEAASDNPATRFEHLRGLATRECKELGFAPAISEAS